MFVQKVSGLTTEHEIDNAYGVLTLIVYSSVSQTFFKWGPLSLVRMFYGPPYSWDYHTH